MADNPGNETEKPEPELRSPAAELNDSSSYSMRDCLASLACFPGNGILMLFITLALAALLRAIFGVMSDGYGIDWDLNIAGFFAAIILAAANRILHARVKRSARFRIFSLGFYGCFFVLALASALMVIDFMLSLVL